MCQKNMITQTENKSELYSVRTAQGALTLTYRLFEHHDIESGNYRYSLYAEVCENGEDENVYIPYISSSKAEAELLLARICRGHVTPCTLPDVISDIFESDRE